jgi:protein translocase SecG subunit
LLNAILIAAHVTISVVLVVLILLHSGKDSGMASITGFSFSAQASVMEKNLTRYTIICGVAFIGMSFILGWRM